MPGLKSLAVSVRPGKSSGASWTKINLQPIVYKFGSAEVTFGGSGIRESTIVDPWSSEDPNRRTRNVQAKQVKAGDVIDLHQAGLHQAEVTKVVTLPKHGGSMRTAIYYKDEDGKVASRVYNPVSHITRHWTPSTPEIKRSVGRLNDLIAN